MVKERRVDEGGKDGLDFGRKARRSTAVPRCPGPNRLVSRCGIVPALGD